MVCFLFFNSVLIKFLEYLRQSHFQSIFFYFQGAYVVHIFPPGEFSRERLKACSSDIQTACGEFPHLLVIITTV